MKLLIDECNDHDYIFLKRESMILIDNITKVIAKDIYACVYCGKGLDVYNIDEPIEVSNE